MTIPFLDIFKRAKARFSQNSEPVEMPSPRAVISPAKAAGDRLSKTVMPNTTRSSAPDPFRTAPESAPNIKLPVLRPSQLPPTVALALQPKVERAISLQLRDILDQLPAGFVKPSETVDSTQPILFKASEVEKGMGSGKPTVTLASIYEQAPSIFLRKVAPDDTTQILLPFKKVLDQFQNVQLRADQEEEYDVPQLDTPILQATIEDTQRFGTTLPKIQTTIHPPVRVEPATAQALSSAEPEAVTGRIEKSAVAPKGIPLNLSTSPTIKPYPSPNETASPTRIPFVLPPNGTDGSASERVPASSGPSVPTSAPNNAGPARIPFKIAAPGDDLKPKLTLMPGAISPEEKKAEEPAPAPPKDGLQISLGLRAILQNLPAFQLKGSPEAVAADARVGLPLSLVESQLSTGRIAIPVRIFRDALAPNDRDLITVDEAESPLLLPLQEVLRNLPSAVLKMRDDQEEVDPVEAFETPFSIKAAEDAKRFQETLQVAQKGSAISAVPAVPAAQSNNVAVAPVVKPLALALEAKSQVEEKANTETKSELTVASKAVKKVDANTNAKDMVSRVSALPGVAACSITFEDGLSLAGNLPDDVQVGGLCAMAPSVLQRISRHTVDTKLGPLQSMTLHCGEAKMSFFMKGSVCLTVLHAGGDLTSDTHNKLAQMANELSRTYSQPETVHVDH